MKRPTIRKCCGTVAQPATPHLDRCGNEATRQAVRANRKKFNARSVPAAETEPDWGGECEVCNSTPIVPATGMCGPCTFGEAETIGGNW